MNGSGTIGSEEAPFFVVMSAALFPGTVPVEHRRADKMIDTFLDKWELTSIIL